MDRDRRFGYALFVLALGNAMLAVGNLAAGGETYFVVFEGLAALVLAALAYTFAYGGSELAVEDASGRVVALSTALIAAVGVVLSAVGFLMTITA